MSPDIRQRIALEAARILADQGYLSIADARRKAAMRLGCMKRQHLPDNQEIETALLEYQQLFQSQHQPAELKRLRELASTAMRSLTAFHPLLTGPVLTGSADAGTAIRLHLFSDTTEEVILLLLEQRIPWEESDVNINYSDGNSVRRPLLSFQAGETGIELLILPPLDRRNPPLSPLNRQPEKGASLIKVLKILEES